MNILVLNCGSSTVKFQIIQTDLEMMKNGTERCLASGNCEKIGAEDALYSMKATGTEGIKGVRPLKDHREAIVTIFDWINSGKAGIEGVNSLKDIDAVGHRILHSGERFRESILIDDDVLQGILDLAELGPLHQVAQHRGIVACREILGKDIPQTAVFDTAFHSTMEPKVFLYGLPYEYYEKYKIRRYGFHGTSHRYITGKYAEYTNTPIDKVNIISLHLGNGSSLAAVKGGKCMDTSMGFTPLEGLLMGTRCGDIDPYIPLHIFKTQHKSIDEVNNLLNKESGMLGLCGYSDNRDVEAAIAKGDEKAIVANDVYIHSILRFIGSYIAVLGGVDAIVFTAGVGENSPALRKALCQRLSYLGIELDEEANNKRGETIEISKPGSKVHVYVIPTDEELVIAQDTVRLIK